MEAGRQVAEDVGIARRIGEGDHARPQALAHAMHPTKDDGVGKRTALKFGLHLVREHGAGALRVGPGPTGRPTARAH